MPEEPTESPLVLCYAKARARRVNWKIFIICTVIVWFLLIVFDGIDAYRHKDAPPSEDFGKVSLLQDFGVGAGIITILYVPIVALLAGADGGKGDAIRIHSAPRFATRQQNRTASPFPLLRQGLSPFPL